MCIAHPYNAYYIPRKVHIDLLLYKKYILLLYLYVRVLNS